MQVKETANQALPAVCRQQGMQHRKSLLDKPVHIVEKQVPVDLQPSLFDPLWRRVAMGITKMPRKFALQALKVSFTHPVFRSLAILAC